MTTTKYNSYSVYSATPQVVNNGVSYLDFWTPPALTASPNDQFITLASRYNLRPDLLAYDYYKKSDYWWVFMMRNPDVISDPIWDFKTGIQIFVPSVDSLPRSILS
jgi:hypothetical protein